jgi:hypothetical protein
MPDFYSIMIKLLVWFALSEHCSGLFFTNNLRQNNYFQISEFKYLTYIKSRENRDLAVNKYMTSLSETGNIFTRTGNVMVLDLKKFYINT